MSLIACFLLCQVLPTRGLSLLSLGLCDLQHKLWFFQSSHLQDHQSKVFCLLKLCSIRPLILSSSSIVSSEFLNLCGLVLSPSGFVLLSSGSRAFTIFIGLFHPSLFFDSVVLRFQASGLHCPQN